MKKTYTKPEISFESFLMSTNIAGGCEFINDLKAQNDCGYLTRNGVVFVQAVTGCTYKQPDTNDALCYHVPTVYTNIFNS